MRTLSSTMLHAVSDGVVRDEALQTEIIELADRVPTFRMGDPRVASIVTRTVAHINTTRQSSQAGE
jgi:Cdc6-like AAA superfamily ATPase